MRQHRRRRAKLIGTPAPVARAMGLLAALSVASCTRSPSEGQPAASAAASATAPRASSEAPALDSETRGWDLDHPYNYQLKLTTSASLGEGASSFDLDVVGTL